ncbi:MAG: KOW domain-containing RNA-binding protein [Oscillospiraceae bacterium]|nr:KOW domain-containing RNA-binding protein [Oscillospiraceae bacterium]
MTPGNVVIPIAGREKGRLHIVLDIDNEFALIADGKRRRVEKPKRKKIKHMEVAEGYFSENAKTNKEIRRVLAIIKNEIEEGEPCQKKI